MLPAAMRWADSPKKNRCGKGNPFGRRAAEVRARIASIMTDEAVDDIITAQMIHARQGDLQAAKFLMG